MKEPTSDTEGRYGDGAARTKVRSPKPKALFYHVCSNRIELLFQNGKHKVALVRSAIKQVAKRLAPSAKAKEVRQVQVKLTIAFWQAISTKKHSLIGLVLHLSTDRASLADWAFSAEFQDSGTKKFLFITGRIRLSILVLEKWVVNSMGNLEKRSRQSGMYRPGPTHEAGGNRYPRESAWVSIQSKSSLLSLPLSDNEFTTSSPWVTHSYE
ncbi:hypothetical protein L1987_45899 [Smallanthus sonchifolius]|uniref:Uncharacterized protein n=1 Tax=Smallanthus sonchifolius TaxID=185202 RepID=A0ACB9FZA1_9ASTR|nr:hypothetical protein L1987_45899 [Smallanthus sonchifolius]